MKFPAVALLCALSSAAPGAAQRVTEPSGEPRTPAGDVPYTIDDSTKAVDPAKPDMIGRIENELLALDAELENLAQRAGEESRVGLRDVRRKRMALQQEIERVRAAAQDDWRAMRPRLEKALGELKTSFGRFREQVRPKSAPAPDDPTP